MNKYVSLVLSLIIFADVIMSFVNDKEIENVFGFEMNVWLYRFLWFLLAFLLAKSFVQRHKEDKITEK